MRSWITKYRYVLLALILLFALLTRIWRIQVPDSYMFDEVYHAVTANEMAQGRIYEALNWTTPPPEPNTAIDWLHPPLAKYTQAGFIAAFGYESWVWRLSSVIFGVGVVGATYLLARSLFQDEVLALAAASLTALDGLLLVLSRIAMNDIHVTFFILITLWLYWSKARYGLWKDSKGAAQRRGRLWLLLTGVSAGLALGSKWSGAYVVGIVGLWESGSRFLHWSNSANVIDETLLSARDLLRHATITILSLLAIPLMIYLLCYLPMFLDGADWDHFTELHSQIWSYQTNLKADHDYGSRPWEWFLNLRPVWFAVDYGDAEGDTIANIYAQGNPLIFWLGATSVVTLTGIVVGQGLAMLWQHWRRLRFTWWQRMLRMLKPDTWTQKNGFLSAATIQSLSFLLIAYGLVWMPWFASPRVMFFYHYTPAVPLLCIALAALVVKVWGRMVSQQTMLMTVTTLLLLSAVVFAMWYPNWTLIHVPESWADQIYFVLPYWK